MKKETAIIIILVVFFTVCNVLFGSMISQIHIQAKTEAEQTRQLYNQTLEELRRQLQLIDLFGYIRAVNPKLSHQETAEFMHLVYTYSEEFGVDPYMIFAKARVETDFNPHKPGQAGELGFIQVMPDTFKPFIELYGYTWDDFKDWRCTLRAGIAHFGYLMIKHRGDWMLAEAEYNAGNRGDWVDRAKYHVQKVVSARNQVSRYREKVKQ